MGLEAMPWEREPARKIVGDRARAATWRRIIVRRDRQRRHSPPLADREVRARDPTTVGRGRVVCGNKTILRSIQ